MIIINVFKMFLAHPVEYRCVSSASRFGDNKIRSLLEIDPRASRSQFNILLTPNLSRFT